jgi:hypothetical protein
LGTKGETVDNELIARIRNHPGYDENLHSTLLEVIGEYTPEQQCVMEEDPIVFDSLLRGMLASMSDSSGAAGNETAAYKFRRRQAEELMRKSWNFLNRRIQEERKAA